MNLKPTNVKKSGVIIVNFKTFYKTLSNQNKTRKSFYN